MMWRVACAVPLALLTALALLTFTGRYIAILTKNTVELVNTLTDFQRVIYLCIYLFVGYLKKLSVARMDRFE
jgi:hypothetical protein